MLLDKLTNAGLNALKKINNNAEQSAKKNVQPEDKTKTQEQLKLSLDASAVIGKASVVPAAITLPEQKLQEDDIKNADIKDDLPLEEKQSFECQDILPSEEAEEIKQKTEWAVNTFNQFGIDAKVDENGYITISHYCQPSDPTGHKRDWEYSFRKLGIDEDELFERVKEVEGDCDWSDASIQSAPNLEKVGGNFTVGRFARCFGDPMKDPDNLPALKYVGGTLDVNSPKLKELPSLEIVKGNIEGFGGLESIPKLKYVFGNINLYGSYHLSSLPELKYVKGKIKGGHKNFTAMPQLRIAGGIESCGELSDLSSLIYVIGDMNIKDNEALTKLPLLRHVGGKLILNNEIRDLSHLRKVDNGMEVYLHDDSYVKEKTKSGVLLDFIPRITFPELEKIGGSSYIAGGRFVAPNLEEIGEVRTYTINHELFSDCPKLKTIAGKPKNKINLKLKSSGTFTYPNN